MHDIENEGAFAGTIFFKNKILTTVGGKYVLFS